MKNSDIKKIIAGICLVTMTLTGCSNSKNNSSTAGSGVKILYTYSPEEGNTFRDELAQSAKEYADSVGATIDFAYAGDDLETQVNDIDTAAQKGYDVIICIPEDADTARQLIAAANGLPIVFLNSAPDDDVLKADRYVYVGSDEGVAGEYQAQYILNKLSGVKNVVVLKGIKGHSATSGRTESLVDTLTANGISIVYNDYADFNTDIAKKMFNIFLKTGKQYDAICCNNDAMALGVIEALEEHGINPEDVPVLGVDATAKGCEAIKDGKMAYTVYQSASKQGEYAARSAIELARGKSLADMEYTADDLIHVWVPFEEVDASNVDNY